MLLFLWFYPSNAIRAYTVAAMSTAFRFFIAGVLLSASIALAADPVTIHRKPPTTHTRIFDPKAPPPDVHLTGNEAAYTRSSYSCAAAIACTVLTRTDEGPRSSATIRVDELKLDLSLDDTLFLPTNVTAKLTAHEQGHRQIAETIYQSADQVARRLATPLIGQTFTATGASADAASDAASKNVIQKLCDDYMATLPGRSSRVNATFDKLTDHGRNRIPEADAIRQSFDAESHPASAPSTGHSREPG
jgi:hypothetical protein